MKLAWTLATWFGCGRSPIAPGTVGTIGALPLWLLVRRRGPAAVFATACVMTGIGVWASNVVVRETREKDPQRIVIDEVAGVLIALSAARSASSALAAVALFRLFDITKPFPARDAEKLPDGWGVMMDDVVAGLLAAGVLRIVRRR
jgi:phosphatidylglycerophosphatase A